MDKKGQEKKQLRKEYLRIRDAMPVEERMAASRRIVNHLCELRCYQEAEVLLLYYSYRSEVVTRFLIEDLLQQGLKQVYLPKVHGDKMFFYRIRSLNDLSIGYQGILEPSEKNEVFGREITKKKRCLLILPGVAFDKEGNRMGFGKGFYDRFLMEYPGVCHNALAFECQIAEQIPCEVHDQKMQRIITEQNIYEMKHMNS